ncbi:MAG: hypothetical protein J6B88_02400 [Clostridia bacterium]|nr:hypothetical protein [Clostridia bacterium]
MKKTLSGSAPKEDNVKYIYRDKNVSMGDKVQYKNILLKYLRGFKPNFATSANIHDCVTNTDVENTYNMGYEYNGYFWTETDIYHFEKYNMPLNEDFIKYVLSKKGL